MTMIKKRNLLHPAIAKLFLEIQIQHLNKHITFQGTVAFVHRTCLETWLGESNTTRCELCHQVFKTERTPKYTSGRSIWCWCRSAPGTFSRGVRSDILACTIITPLAIVITYVCLFSSEYYSQKKFMNVPAARWTSVSLLVMIGIMLIGYYMWVYSVIRMHARLWYNWWQRTCDVRYIPPSTIEITEPQVTGISQSQAEETVPLCTAAEEISDSSNCNLSAVIINSSQIIPLNSNAVSQCSGMNNVGDT